MSMSSLGGQSSHAEGSQNSQRSYNKKQKTSYNYKNTNLESLLFKNQGDHLNFSDKIVSLNGQATLEIDSQQKLA